MDRRKMTNEQAIEFLQNLINKFSQFRPDFEVDEEITKLLTTLDDRIEDNISF